MDQHQQRPRTRHGAALFGLGRAGSLHFVNLRNSKEVTLLYVVEENISMAQHKVDDWYDSDSKQPKLVSPTDIDMVLSDPKVEFVVVATPTFTHEKILLEALIAGKAVFCEKPIAGYLTSIEKCYDIADEMKKPLFCAFQRRFDPSFKDIYQRVQNKQLGSIQVIKSCSRDNPVPPLEYLKISGGLIHDCLVHDIDMVCWILGEKPKSAFCTTHCNIPEIAAIGDVDTAVALLKFPSGVIAVIDISRVAVYGYDQRLEVHGSKGMLNVANKARDDDVICSTADGITSSSFQYSFPQRYKLAYENELRHFIAVLEGREKMHVTKESTIMASKICDACEESSKTGVHVKLEW